LGGHFHLHKFLFVTGRVERGFAAGDDNLRLTPGFDAEVISSIPDGSNVHCSK
jgi:hypothetical protein